MYTAPNANPTVTTKDGPMAWFRGAERWLDDRGRKAWIITMILAFIFAWPIGLALLAYMIWSKRMFNGSCAHHTSERGGPWARQGHWGAKFNGGNPLRSSGNTAFDAYKAETIRRLQEEQEAFEAFLQRLRDAKDKSEFDSFMEDRAKTTSATTTPEVVPGTDTLRSGEY